MHCSYLGLFCSVASCIFCLLEDGIYRANLPLFPGTASTASPVEKYPALWETAWSASSLRDSLSSTKQNRPLCQVFLMVQNFTQCNHTCHLMTWRALFMRRTCLLSQMAGQFSMRRSLQWGVLASMSMLLIAIWHIQSTLALATCFSMGHQPSLFLYQLLLGFSRSYLDWTKLWSAGDHLNTLLEAVSLAVSSLKSTPSLSRVITSWFPFSWC